MASPGAYFGDIEKAIAISRECNEGSAKMVADRPHQFGAFALLPLPDVSAAAREAAYALDTLKLDGICLLTHAGPRHLGHPDENELYAELDRRKAIHAALERAHRGDVVVIAGRGAEPEQELAHGKVTFDDREVVRTALRALWSAS